MNLINLLYVECLCSHCNKTIVLKPPISSHLVRSHTTSFFQCPHCDERNDVWVQIKIPLESHVLVARLEEDLEEAYDRMEWLLDLMPVDENDLFEGYTPPDKIWSRYDEDKVGTGGEGK